MFNCLIQLQCNKLGCKPLKIIALFIKVNIAWIVGSGGWGPINMMSFQSLLEETESDINPCFTD